MSQGDGFTGGFLIGAVMGGLCGGVIGALVASRAASGDEADASLLNPSGLPEATTSKTKRRRQTQEDDSIEASRRSLEDKIAQLNAAIDEVRLSLGNVNGSALEIDTQRSFTQEP